MRLAVEVRWTSQFVCGDPHRLLTELCGDSGGHRCRTLAFDFLGLRLAKTEKGLNISLNLGFSFQFCIVCVKSLST